MPINVPPDFRNGFLSEIIGKNARIHLVKDGAIVAFLDSDGTGLGRAAALLLGMAQQISPFLGTMAPSRVGTEFSEKVSDSRPTAGAPSAALRGTGVGGTENRASMRAGSGLAQAGRVAPQWRACTLKNSPNPHLM
jgi:hypothetical protein